MKYVRDAIALGKWNDCPNCEEKMDNEKENAENGI